ncbi:hypothetical protein R69927_07349 [Paraburkholderia domus]|uniref:Uncharacterized protein n=1 Tax=Paraburkholderia domus TaxID=2793075 RepID=A0A9N8N2Q1_9BURK|nr:hypothetical protein [Paraburkholderia domus]MBK5091761.1 hypothetical protein [Burkholderia sp. R-69927]MBK5118943.1 hypothetical protein [Burkholderia sp. R-69980]MBK5168106.1 hypothetical protein [Burkholderia sp. R-70211]MBK5183327.1 hypothetical protein [Burkholderia sp. R-69749]MCI0152374.1 hypothetical protein [Paraburkholderia sediminicola]
MKILGTILYLFGILGGVTALSITIGLWQEKPVGLPCHVVGRDGTLYVREGFGGVRTFLVNEGNSFLLAAQGAHTHGPLPVEILQGLSSGSVLHVEFCGPQPVRLTSNGGEVYKLTQERAEENVTHGVISTARVTAFCFVIAILGFLMGRRASTSDV